MEDKQRATIKKFHQHTDQTFHLEMMYDSPLPVENPHPSRPGMTLKGARFLFKDIDTGEMYSTIFGQQTKVCMALMGKRKGDQIDLTHRTKEVAPGKIQKYYEVNEYGTTQSPNSSAPAYEKKEPPVSVTLGDMDIDF